MKKLVLLGVIIIFLITFVGTGTAIAVGNGRSGYNYKARIFVGTGCQWCMKKFSQTEEYCRDYLGIYADDKLVMKWNAEWDRGNEEEWSDPDGYHGAWSNNQWNGMFPGGSGETWHYMNRWIGPCGVDGTPTPNGGYCIWGQFEVVMSHGTFDGQHFWDAHTIPAGVGP